MRPARTPWPSSVDELIATQLRLATAAPEPWQEPGPTLIVGGCFACGQRGLVGRGDAGDPVWAAAVAHRRRRRLSSASVRGIALGPYRPGLLALRVGPGMAAAVAALTVLPDVLIVDATGRDHPRRAGLALHLGAHTEIPTIGVTHRPLLAVGDWPDDRRGATSPLVLDGCRVGYWLRTRSGTRPVAVHAGWRVDPDTAVRVVLGVAGHRTVAPLRDARRLARMRRADASADTR